MLLRKFLTLSLAAIVFLLFVGCNNTEDTHYSNANQDTLSIVTTVFPSYDFSKEITGGKAEVTMLLPAGSESHSYEPTPKDIVKIENSDVFIYVGGESEKWVESILDGIDTSKTKIISLMKCVGTLQEATHNHEDEGAHDNDVEYDEHVWTSPKNSIEIVKSLTEEFVKLDSNNASVYTDNSEAYIKQLSELDSQFEEVVSTSKNKMIVFGDRFPFIYFARAYSLDYLSAFPGCSSETEPSAATMATIIDTVNNKNLPVIFYMEMSNQKVADTICESTKAKKLLFHSCHTITKDELEKGENYISLMKANVKNLKTALN